MGNLDRPLNAPLFTSELILSTVLLISHILVFCFTMPRREHSDDEEQRRAEKQARKRQRREVSSIVATSALIFRYADTTI